MNNNVIKSTHPLVIIAALSLTLFSVAGVAALMGWLPSSKGHQAETIASIAKAEPAPAPAAQPVRQSEAPRRARVQHRETVFRDSPRDSIPQRQAQPEPAPVVLAQAEPVRPAAKPAAPVCHDCGVIESVRAVQSEVKPSGVGAAAGGVLGGVLGHQVGNGRGRDLMTVVGAVGGAVAGHQVEKRTRKTTSYEIVVRFDDGTSQKLSEAQAPTWRPGDRVRMVGGQIRASDV